MEEPGIIIYGALTDESMPLPYIEDGVKAGFPSPAADFAENKIDLNKELVKHPFSTFYIKVKGNSMEGAFIHDNDILIVDKSLEPRDGNIAICCIDSEFTVKRIKLDKDICWLIAENEAYEPIKVTPDNDFSIWGIVTHVIKSVH